MSAGKGGYAAHKARMQTHNTLMRQIYDILSDMYAAIDYACDPKLTEQMIDELAIVRDFVLGYTYDSLVKEADSFSLIAISQKPYPIRPKSFTGGGGKCGEEETKETDS